MTQSRDEYLTQTAVTLITTISNSRLTMPNCGGAPSAACSRRQQSKALDRSSKKRPPEPAVVRRPQR